MAKARDDKKIPPYRLVNGTQLAQILGVSPARVSTLFHSGLPRLESKLYDLAQVVPWMMQRALEKGDVQGSGSARQLYFEAMTERAELETAKLRGALYGKDETDQFLMGLAVQLREQIIALPERVTRDRKIAGQLEREIDLFLGELAETVAAWCGDSKTTARLIEAPAKTHRRPVGKRKKKAPGRRTRTG